MVPVDPNLTSEVAVPLPSVTRVHDHVIEQWLRAVPDGYVYRVIHTQTGAVASLHEYLPAAWAFRDAEGVLAKPGRGREFQVGLRRFLLRARQLRELEHPSLPRLMEAWPSHGTACILTAPAATKTLSDVVIAAGGRLPLDQAWPWLCACCDLAEWLHQQGKIHGSWDPETIGVTDDNRLILPMPEVDGPAHPASPWMPLEQTALAPKGVQRGPWTDVFGISGLAAFMLTGQSPATARRQPTAPVINTSPRASRTSASAETLPRAMMAAIRVSLLPNARQRPQDIAQLKAMMGLFATAPVLSEELKAALEAPEKNHPSPRGGLVMPPMHRDAESPRQAGFGELPTEPMPLASADGSRPTVSETRSDYPSRAAQTSSPDATQAYRELAAWNGEEPLPPDPAMRRRLSAGAGAAGAALVALATVWVLVADRPATDRPVTAAESALPADMDRMLKSAPPAAGQTTPGPVTPSPASAESPARGPVLATPAPQPLGQQAAVAAAAPAVVRPAPETAPVSRQGPPLVTAAGEPPAASVIQRPARAPDTDKVAAAASGTPTTTSTPESRTAAATRKPSCSQLLLEQSLGAKVSPADLRNCR